MSIFNRSLTSINSTNLSIGQGVQLTGISPIRLGNSSNRTRFILQCQPLNNGTGFAQITAIRVFQIREDELQLRPVVSVTGLNNIQWQDGNMFQTFLCRPFRYSLEIWCMNFYGGTCTSKIWLLSRFTTFYNMYTINWPLRKNWFSVLFYADFWDIDFKSDVCVVSA